MQAHGDAHVGSYRPPAWPDTSGTGWRGKVDGMRAALDTHLRDALLDALLIIDGTETDAATGGNAAHRRAMARDRRAGQVEPYLQQRCATLVQRVADGLQAMLTESTFASPAAAVEPSLCVATLASALAGPGGALPLVLGPPSAWRDEAKMHRDHAPLEGKARRAEAADGPRGQLRERMTAVADVGVRVWAAWAASCLAEGLVEGLAADDTLALHVPLKSWEEAVDANMVRRYDRRQF